MADSNNTVDPDFSNRSKKRQNWFDNESSPIQNGNDSRPRHAGSRRSHRKRPLGRGWSRGVAIISLIILAVIVVAGILGLLFYVQAQQVKSHEEKALSTLSSLSSAGDADSVEQVASNLSDVQNETSQAREIAHGTLWNVMAKMPFIGGDITTVQGMTTVVDDITQNAMPQFVDVLQTLVNSDLTTADGALNLEPIVSTQGSIESANQVFQNDVQQYNDLPGARISMVSTAYENGKTQLSSLASTVNRLSKTFAILPSILGNDGQQTYAVMAETNAEMRSSGGLIGAIGSLTADHGEVAVGDFHSNGDYLKVYSGAADHTEDEDKVFSQTGPLIMSLDIRDIAAFPNTENVANAMKSEWNRMSWNAGTELDGIIMVDPVFLQELIAITGNVTLSNGTVLTGDNTAEYLLNTVYLDYGNDNSASDAVFGEVAESAVSEMFSNISLNKLIRVANLMGNMAEQRHFTMYSFDESVETDLIEAGFTATTPDSAENPEVGVYFNEQQGSKMAWYLDRTATIECTSCGAHGTTGGATYHVEYALTNTLSADLANSLPRYVAGMTSGQEGWLLEKTLIYAPAGGSISGLSITGSGLATDPEQVPMNGDEPYMSVITIKPGQSMTIAFDVTVSQDAMTTLGIDQTPLNSTESNVTYTGKTCTLSGK